MLNRPIAISLSPNAETDDVVLAIRQLFDYRNWHNATPVVNLEKALENYFGKGYQSFAVNSGRSGLFLALKALGLGKGDEVLIQAFTCVAVPNSVIWTGARPVYVDIDETYNINLEDLRKKMTKRSKAVIIQHTFGIPLDIDRLKQITSKNGIALIEDCAHSFGGIRNGRKIGSESDISVLSFGRDKVLSSVFGGAILTRDKKTKAQLAKLVGQLGLPSKFWILQQLVHPILFSLLLPFYNFGFGKYTLGKALLVCLQKMNFLSLPVTREEKLGQKIDTFPALFPGALSQLALRQLTKLARFNDRRKKIASIYFDRLRNSGLILPPDVPGSVWLRFPVRHARASELYDYAKAKGILLGNWYKGIVDPAVDRKLVGFVEGSCPKARDYSATVINLPTYPMLTDRQVYKVVDVIKQWFTYK